MEIPPDLIDAIVEGSCVLFAGPGTSIPGQDRLGPPGEALLALELINRLSGQLEDYSFPWVAQYYADQFGLDALSSYVSKRIGDVRYRPTRSQHLISRLPFHVVVYTGLDILLRGAFQHNNVPIRNYVLGTEGKVVTSRGTFIQLFGNSERRESLVLTEDARRRMVRAETDLANDLRGLANNNVLLFLGYSLTDPFFREFYFQLRLVEEDERLPRAFLVWPEVSEVDHRYWGGRHATVVPADLPTFLEELVGTLEQSGQVEVVPGQAFEDPPLMSREERAQRDELVLGFSRRFGFSGAVESGDQFQPGDRSLALFQQVVVEQDMLRGPVNLESEGQSTQAGIQGERLKAQILLQRGNVEWAEGDHTQAQEAFQQAIELDPGLIEAYLSLYYLQVEIGKLDEAAATYEQILELAPDRAFLPERYRIEEILGQTELGISYCVMDQERGELVTATVLRRSYTQRIENLQAFLETIGTVESPRISRLLESDRYRMHVYLITEFFEGRPLSEVLKTREQLEFSEALRIADQVAEALEDGHRFGVPHLGLQPSTILIGPQGEVKIVTYGFSRLLDSGGPPAGGHARGRMVYESPEQRGGAPGDERTDVYALGTLLYEMLVGRPPGLGRFEQISELYPEADEALDLAIAHAREVDPARRFETVTDMRRELLRINLAVQRGWFGQYLRVGLARISGLYAGLFSRAGAVVVLALLVGILAAELVGLGGMRSLRGITRFAGLLLVTTPATAVMGYYVVRETARQQGLGSLISGGRGMGAVFGWLMIFWLFRITDFGSETLASLELGDYAGYIFLSFLIGTGMTLLFLALLQRFGSATRRRYRRYPLGFYIGFIALCVVQILGALLRTPQGIFVL